MTVKASHYPRFWFEVALSVASGLLGLVTLVWQDWIEIVFGVDPDHHSGTLEWVIVFALLLIAVIAGVLTRADWGRRHRRRGAGTSATLPGGERRGDRRAANGNRRGQLSRSGRRDLVGQAPRPAGSQSLVSVSRRAGLSISMRLRSASLTPRSRSIVAKSSNRYA